MTLMAATIPAYGHGGRFPNDPPPFIIVHSTEGPMADGNARGLAEWFARSPTNGGPGTSATDIYDPSEGITMLDDHTVPYDVGPNANDLGTGDEHCGSVALTAAQWMSDRAQAMLDRSARRNALRAHSRGWGLAQCRWLTLTEVARHVPGFCSHNDIRLAIGGTTHSDPGPNFPYAWYMTRVRFWFVNPNGTLEGILMALTDAEQGEVLKAARQINGSVSAGQTSFTSTFEALLPTLQGLVNNLGTVKAAVVANSAVTGDDEAHILARMDAAQAEIDSAVAAVAAKIPVTLPPTTG